MPIFKYFDKINHKFLAAYISIFFQKATFQLPIHAVKLFKQNKSHTLQLFIHILLI